MARMLTAILAIIRSASGIQRTVPVSQPYGQRGCDGVRLLEAQRTRVSDIVQDGEDLLGRESRQRACGVSIQHRWAAAELEAFCFGALQS